MEELKPQLNLKLVPKPHVQDVITVGQEVEVKPVSERTNKTCTNITDKDHEDWLLADDDSDADLDLDLNPDFDGGILPVMRNAAIEPACNADMTELQAQVLQAEDEINDRVLRDIVPNDDYYRFDWKKDRTHFTGQRETFTGQSGPTFDVTDKTPVDIFKKMFDSSFIDQLCRETNRYAEQKIAP